MKAGKKNVLVLASTFPRWENDTTPPFVFELEKRLANDFNIQVLAPHFPGAKKYEKMENLTVHRFQYFWPAGLQKLCYEGGILPNIKKNKLLIFQGLTLMLFELFAAIKIIKKEQIDLIHAHWIIPQGPIALFLKKIFGIPYIVTTHGGDIYGLQNKLLIYIKKVILENAQSITVVSTAIKDEILKKINPKLKIAVISMGVDPKLFNPNKYDKSIKEKFDIEGPLLLFVGRLAEKKGVRYLLQAMPDIIRVIPNIKLLIIGQGTLEKELKTLSKNIDIENNTYFIGAIPNSDLPKYYATADIFIGPSIQTGDGDTEGLGLTFIEASFSGCIPIGTNIGGIPDVINNKKTGFLVKEKNPKNIAETVINLLSDSKLISNIKLYTRLQTIKKFDWENVSDKYKYLFLN